LYQQLLYQSPDEASFIRKDENGQSAVHRPETVLGKS